MDISKRSFFPDCLSDNKIYVNKEFEKNTLNMPDPQINKQENSVIELAKRPSGIPDESTFRFRKIDIPVAKSGQVLLKSLYVSVDPYMRGRMRDAESYAEPFKVDDPIVGGIVAEVVESKSSAFKQGDIVQGRLQWKKYQTASPDNLQQVDPELAPISTALSTLGMTGLTAYFGLLRIGRPQKGETVVISGAAGAVGSVVAQIAKIKGCRVVGTAGSDQKIDYLEHKLGIEKGINYKRTDDIKSAFEEACPNGVDVYFDNVGGELSDNVLSLINTFARIAVCGQIALYNQENQPIGPRVQPLLLTKCARMEGFLVNNFTEDFEAARKQLAAWYREGKLKHKETTVEGFKKIPAAFIGLFSGENTGKQIVKV
jgi:NADPH-dependent curcumin reductase CurA